MKILALCCLAPCASAHVQALAANFRLIGTNVYDFTYAGSPSNPSPYVIHGKIGHIYPQSVELLIPDGVRYEADPQAMRATINYGGPSQMLNALAAMRMSQQPMSPGAYNALSPGTRANLIEVPNYHSIYVLHLTRTVRAANLSPGQGIVTLALPTTIPDFWDHGLTVTNPVCARFFRVYPNRIEILTNRPSAPVPVTTSASASAADSL